MKVPVLITGGAGYIGSHTAKLLARSGFEPIAFDNLTNAHESSVRWGPFVYGDLARPAQIRAALRRYRIQAVVHFAADAYVGESVEAPRKYFRNNVVGTLNLLDAMIDAGVRQLIFSSSCAVYGCPQRVPITEEHPGAPVNPYGESKLIAERTLHWYEQAYGLRWMALRYFNAAGADIEGDLGESHSPETHLIPLVIQAAQRQSPVVKIYGTDYPTPDGTAIRDYIHVSDLANAHVLALKHLRNGGRTAAMNLGTGEGNSVRQIISAVEKISGRSIRARELPRRCGDPAELVANAGKAARVLGWQPTYSGLETIIDSAWRWHESQAARAPELVSQPALRRLA